ncbi:MAG: shikimate dehydrogenase [Rhodospirillaceae bacterium]|nr:shikimate dehydrogenase [Rhodospirillaceae bacterium]|tara:strand:- start:581 stop:1393 length:813 start_codon:yes stop_codon:yes gene_type:complete
MEATLKISGKTRVYGCISDPISHVRAPSVFNPLFEKHGIDAVMVPLHVPADNLASVIQGLRAMPNFGGMSVTLPHKLPIMKFCDDIGHQGQLVGAVNFAAFDEERRLIGDNCDGDGFVHGLLAAGFTVEGRKILMIGAGGAARAIAFSLAEHKASHLSIANRTMATAEKLAEAVEVAYPNVDVMASSPDPRGFEIVINTTSLGLREDDQLPLDPQLLEKGQLMAEIIMNPEETQILKAAKQRGCRVHFGRPMFDHQVAIQAKLFGYNFSV